MQVVDCRANNGRGQLAIEQLMRQAILKHMDNMPHSASLSFYDKGINAEAVSALEDLDMQNAVDT